MVIALIALLLTDIALLWFIRDQVRKHDQRVDELLTWIKDTPTAVVRSDNGHSEPHLATVVDDDEMVRREAQYEPETAAAGPDDA